MPAATSTASSDDPGGAGLAPVTVTAVATRTLAPGEDLAEFVVTYLPAVPERSVLVVASKAVSFAERCLVADAGDDQQVYALVRDEADLFVDPHLSRYQVMLTIKGGWMFANAGIDRSNADGQLALWPVDPQRSCERLWQRLRAAWSVDLLGVIVTDSGGIPLNWGVVSRAIAHCGFEALRSYVGRPDLFGRPMQMERANLAQGLAAAAGVVMGEGAESRPLALIAAPEEVAFQDRPPSAEELAGLRISLEEDLYAPVLAAAPWQPGGAGGGRRGSGR